MNNRITGKMLAVFLFVLLSAGCGSSGRTVYQTAQSVSSAGTEVSASGSLEETLPEETVSEEGGDEVSGASEEPEELIYVYVCGAVARPGVYPLPAGSRVYEALEAAGGTTGDTDEKYLNQAQLLQDGQQITVYTRDEIERLEAAGQAVNPLAGNAGQSDSSGPSLQKVNINTAGKEQLMTLPGIGEAKAEAIIQYRESQGYFSSPEDIRNVPGIKDKAYEKIKDCIEV